MNDNAPPPTPNAEDEIDLIKLFEELWAQKWLIMAVTGAASIIGLAAALLLPPVYQASTQVRPADLSDLALINETEMMLVTPNDAFRRGLNELESRHSRIQTFSQLLADGKLESPEGDKRSLRAMTDNITVSVPQAGNGSLDTKDYVTVTYDHGDGKLAAEVVNSLVTIANQKAADTLVEELRSSIEARASLLEQGIQQEIDLQAQSNIDRAAQLKEIDQLRKLELQDQIDALRAKNLQLRQDRIQALEEALSIARTLNIEDPVLMAQMRDEAFGGGLAVRGGFDDKGSALYLRGTRMLEAEISALKNRQSDDFTSPQIRNLQEQLARLEHNREIELLMARKNNSAYVEDIREMRTELNQLRGYLDQDYSNVRVMKMDDAATAPMTPIKPRRTLIVAVSALSGAMLGILAALIASTLAHRRERQELDSRQAAG
ncbi:Wzz/FepE/Etk N-terminal domain-containing protein [Parahaliea mediterranea]|uniref:Polysaccharide chain length determinant N-terminal domain-containing protein n=1 Tax=Parahaliea mediterranea TaxID=651086 RepID=A0A939IN70_9GAMM|nr:Wzz/FepE/Etk N-terminal domain-containing protein [Parahaliea mediterranea]MBN7797793.1 hypothetical protein [Parahaliea mediterranea]